MRWGEGAVQSDLRARTLIVRRDKYCDHKLVVLTSLMFLASVVPPFMISVYSCFSSFTLISVLLHWISLGSVASFVRTASKRLDSLQNRRCRMLIVVFSFLVSYRLSIRIWRHGRFRWSRPPVHGNGWRLQPAPNVTDAVRNDDGSLAHAPVPCHAVVLRQLHEYPRRISAPRQQFNVAPYFLSLLGGLNFSCFSCCFLILSSSEMIPLSNTIQSSFSSFLVGTNTRITC